VLPVTTNDAHVSGVVTLEDLGYLDVNRQEIDVCETVMHKPAIMNEQVSLQYIAKFMIETQQDHVFILNRDDRLIGVVSGIDVVKKILELLSS
jgi:predicted transcriptional regulator